MCLSVSVCDSVCFNNSILNSTCLLIHLYKRIFSSATLKVSEDYSTLDKIWSVCSIFLPFLLVLTFGLFCPSGTLPPIKLGRRSYCVDGGGLKLGVLCSFQGERLPHHLWKSGSLCQGLVFPCCALVSGSLWKSSSSFTSVRCPSVSQLGALCVCNHLKYKIAPPHSTLLSFAVLLTLPNVWVAVIST